MKFLLLAALVAVATAAPGLIQPGPSGPVPAPNPEDSFIPNAIGPAVIDSFEPVSIGAVTIEGFGPIAAIVDTPVDLSSIDPHVQIVVKVDAAPGAIVNVHADACRFHKTLGVAPVRPEPIQPVHV